MRLFRSLAALATTLPATTAHACTVCDSPTGHQLRAGLFNGHFLHTLAIVVAPVPVFVLAVLLLHRAMPDLPEARHELTAAQPFADGLLPTAAAEPAL